MIIHISLETRSLLPKLIHFESLITKVHLYRFKSSFISIQMIIYVPSEMRLFKFKNSPFYPKAHSFLFKKHLPGETMQYLFNHIQSVLNSYQGNPHLSAYLISIPELIRFHLIAHLFLFK
jgi:hypothetical protein